MTGPRRLSAILEGWHPQSGGAGGDAAAAVAAAWHDAVGSDVARRTRPGKLRDGVLTVYTAGSTWSHQLTFLAPTIIAELNRRCPSSPVERLRFVVASGRTKALLDGMAKSPAARSRDRAARQPASADLDAGADDVEGIIERLRIRQRSLDRRREREGWSRCSLCRAWRAPTEAAGDTCAVCADEARRASDNRIERMLVSAPWLRRADVLRHVADADDADDAAYERVRNRLLVRWGEQMFAARRRLRKGLLQATDRVIAWSYLMLRAGMQQHVIGRAVIADALGDDWADALATASSARHREATATVLQKQRNTSARAFTRRNNT